MRLLIVLLVLSGISSCHTNEGSIPEGGYHYPDHFSDEDTLVFFYPLKDSISSRDSFELSMYTTLLFGSFEEPNLSLVPPEKPLYRMVYIPSIIGNTTIITLHEHMLEVKEIKQGGPTPWVDTENLDSLEREHLHILESYFPIEKYEGKIWTKNYLDSLAKASPELLDVNYYRNLVESNRIVFDDIFAYNKREVPLTKEQYSDLVNLIDKSGYWKMKPSISCPAAPMDGHTYIFEAATKYKYNFVEYYAECNDKPSDFLLLIRELMRISGVEESEEKFREDFFEKRRKGEL